MHKAQETNSFIGRSTELEALIHWLEDPASRRILYVHDAAKEAEKKGGLGKTYLLRRFAQLVQQKHPEIAVVMIDFFNVGDRDRLFLAEKIIAGLQVLYPDWSPDAFEAAIQRYRNESSQNPARTYIEGSGTKIRDATYAALQQDLQQLNQDLAQVKKTLLILFDTFETIEQSPDVAVLGRSQVFPDTYRLSQIRNLIAGRNSLDWSSPNWIGREKEVQILELDPFNQKEMIEYLDEKSIYTLVENSDQANALYERTEGRPIIIGLTIDVLNHRILTLDELLAISRTDFEKSLVPQINKLEEPINWVILFMAHVYHRFNISVLDWILHNVPQDEPLKIIGHDELNAALPGLSFVRKPGSGDDFVLHDEMRRLVNKYCWEQLDPDQRYRKEISASMISYYDSQIKQPQSEQQRQSYIIERLYHLLFIDQERGLHYFLEQFEEAMEIFKPAFMHLMLQEIEKFQPHFSLAQKNTIQLRNIRLLRGEENPTPALKILQQLREDVDPEWYEENKFVVVREEGRCYLQQSRLKEAQECYQLCLEIERTQDGDPSRLAGILTNLGLIARRRGQFAEALEFYEQSIEIYKKLGLRDNYATILNNMAVVYRRQGKLEEALRRCKIAWRIRVELAETQQISETDVALSLHNMGQIYLDAGKTIEAEKSFYMASDIMERNNDKSKLALIYNRFGQVQLNKGDTEGAKLWFTRGKASAREVDTEQYINSLNKLGRISLQKGHLSEARASFEEAIELARKVPDYFQQTESLIDISETLEQMQLPDMAEEYLRQAQEIATHQDYVDMLGVIEQKYGLKYYELGKYAQAFQHLIKYCDNASQYNTSLFNTAIQQIVDVILELPKDKVLPIITDMISYWIANKRDQEYPELILALEEIKEELI
ncbi:hypothetical protein KDA_68870 [Dictyobacter alpinus]|uniref:Uncharacterized protein n=1 Tax=Dictyobacter alpinus TaxID=2014873 RepID=A0A402BJ58_9CHLR|nr:tetratricopeptide repeat protein [Dictyobacter alpinus]GCE31403.1 hypothetical protein KDA_68870 [Dictyobacter alpinus]